jgi:hypothetical protein
MALATGNIQTGRNSIKIQTYHFFLTTLSVEHIRFDSAVAVWAVICAEFPILQFAAEEAHALELTVAIGSDAGTILWRLDVV